MKIFLILICVCGLFTEANVMYLLWLRSLEVEKRVKEITYVFLVLTNYK